MKSIGIDFGSISTKAVVLDDAGQIERTLSTRAGETDFADLNAFLDGIDGREALTAGIVGFDGDRQTAPSLQRPNALLAIARGVLLARPQARSIIEIGGHTSKFLVIDWSAGIPSIRDFATNEACAAGTGSFLEQQAKRLTLSVDQLAKLSLDARAGATIAGRCSVFAKSDMIHLQQKGTPVEEIAYGLCLAISRNALATLLKGRDIETPVVIAGGCAMNLGVLRAFREVLALADPGSIAVSAWPGLEAAIGAAILARESSAPRLALKPIRADLRALLADQRRNDATLAPLVRPKEIARRAEPESVQDQRTDAFVGIDLGSVSTDIVLLDRNGDLLSSIYLPTRGRPVDVLLEGLAALQSRFPGGLRIAGCGTTGSGRHLAGRLIGADVVKNEITCQLLGARRFIPDVDTILEIGGQDSKFISLRNGAIADFAMNKICAAGTGSFLEEQAQEIGIDIYGEFSEAAFTARAPLDLGTRCTVFMETEVVNAIRAGSPAAEICAGLAYSIVRNYLDKVVGLRPIGNVVVFQGGVASNDAVVAAFETVLGKAVHVHPYNRISGAIGAALSAMGAAKTELPSDLARRLPQSHPSLRTFECELCANRCEVNVLEMTGKRRAFFGDTCERYTSRSGEKSTEGVPPNLAEEYVERCESAFKDAGNAGLSIGIPRASTLFGSLMFWATFFKALGHRPVLSPPSSEETLSLGLKHLAVGVCLPIKLTAGHAQTLIGSGVDLVFVPSVVLLPGDDPSRSFSCPYAMAVPFIISSKRETKFLAPVISFQSEDEFIAGFAPYRDMLGTTPAKLREAWREARAAQEKLDEEFRARARSLIDRGEYRKAFAILGKPYNTLDGYLNLSLCERLRRLRVLAVPQKFLPLGPAGFTSELPWRFSADLHTAAAAVARSPELHPVIVSNFGCGPDAFTLRQVEEVLGDRPHLLLEFDEHRAEAGLITRLEAFLDQLESAPGAAAVRRRELHLDPAVPPAGSVVRVPYFADQAHAYSGLLRLIGCDASVLPPPSAATRALGERYSLGKECHAYSMIAGDLLDVSRRSNGDRQVFFFPGTSLPCLLHEYGRGMRMLLGQLGIDNVAVCAPTGMELFEVAGIEAMERFYLGLLSIELLVKAVCQVRPYEEVRGEADGVHRRNLLEIETAIAGGNILAALDESLGRLSSIATERSRRRPLVGIAGDIYTKINPAANNDLFRWLEERGLEVWPSPFQIDLLDIGISRSLHQSVERLDVRGLLLSGSLAARRALHQWRVRYVVGGRITRPDEPGYLTMKELTAPYMSNDLHQLLFINVGKIVDFARSGADGVINAICFNCMVGNASAAVIEKIRRDHDNIPIVSAVYAGGENPSRRIVLEAFVSQVIAHHEKRAAHDLALT